MSQHVSRVQFVLSGWSLGFFVLSLGLLTGGYWLYIHQPQPQHPPYYVSRTATAIRPCFQCVAIDGKMKDSKDWKLGKAIDVPEDKQTWFAPVDDEPIAIKLDGVPMLAVHPATDNDKPWIGFDQRKIYFAVFQDLEPRFSIEHPTPQLPQQPIPAPVPSGTAPTSDQPVDSSATTTQ